MAHEIPNLVDIPNNEEYCLPESRPSLKALLHKAHAPLRDNSPSRIRLGDSRPENEVLRLVIPTKTWHDCCEVDRRARRHGFADTRRTRRTWLTWRKHKHKQRATHDATNDHNQPSQSLHLVPNDGPGFGRALGLIIFKLVRVLFLVGLLVLFRIILRVVAAIPKFV